MSAGLICGAGYTPNKFILKFAVKQNQLLRLQTAKYDWRARFKRALQAVCTSVDPANASFLRFRLFMRSIFLTFDLSLVSFPPDIHTVGLLRRPSHEKSRDLFTICLRGRVFVPHYSNRRTSRCFSSGVRTPRGCQKKEEGALTSWLFCHLE